MKPPFQLKDYLESLSAPFPSGHVLVLPLLVAELFSKVRTTHYKNLLFVHLFDPSPRRNAAAQQNTHEG